jgi:glycosyltransferase involved in cell wall biosynthesis
VADATPSLSIVIMAYNEAGSIAAQARATADFLRRVGSNGQVVIVDDGSRDGTGAIADALAAEDPIHTVVHHPTNLGMGRAIRSGYAAARCEFVSQLPGDGQVVPDTLERFLPHLATHDLVLSTYTRRDDGLARKVVTAGYQATARVLLGDRCAFTGTMVFRRAWLDRIRLTCDSFLVNVELPLKLMRAGVVPAHVTIQALERAHGRSKVLSARRVAHVVAEMLALRRELVVRSTR